MTDTKSHKLSIADMLGTNPERIHSDDSAFLPSRRRRAPDAEREIAALKAKVGALEKDDSEGEAFYKNKAEDLAHEIAALKADISRMTAEIARLKLRKGSFW